MSVQPESKTLDIPASRPAAGSESSANGTSANGSTEPVATTPFATRGLHPLSDDEESTVQVDYRSLHTPAMVSVVLGAASLISLLMASTSIDATLVMCTIPLGGLIVGLRALVTIRRHPDVWTGLRFAWIGTLLSAFFLIVSPLSAMYDYATEVPDGYERLTFAQMKPDDKQAAKGVFIPPEVLALNGKRVFIKGYMRPSSQAFGLNNFLLVRDNNQCCFGELSEVKYYDQVQVLMQGERRADYSRGVFRMGGTLQVDPAGFHPQSGKPVFKLLADYIR